MRKDARRSRRAILDAARELYRDDAEASFAEIAHHAGVGQATVYRHFDDRQIRHRRPDQERREQRWRDDEAEPAADRRERQRHRDDQRYQR